MLLVDQKTNLVLDGALVLNPRSHVAPQTWPPISQLVGWGRDEPDGARMSWRLCSPPNIENV